MYALQISSLPEATAPPERRGLARDEVRLMVTHRSSGTNRHLQFLDLPSVLTAGDLLVVNDSATIPAALQATREDGSTLNVHIATRIDRRLWMIEPRESVRCGEELQLPGGGSVVAIAPVEPEMPRVWYAWFQLPCEMFDYLARYGRPIRYGYVTQEFPLTDYQTIFARERGSSEMPSAARPFSSRVLHVLEQRRVEIASITLHCGVASFEQPERPPMERYRVSNEAVERIERARRQGRRVIAVGSTVLRALESSFQDGHIVPSSGWTDIVIEEQSTIRTVDGILTGFHDTAATHQSILRAFLGRRLLAAAYSAASERGYLQHEFGDSHLIL